MEHENGVLCVPSVSSAASLEKSVSFVSSG
jgi:hypothetical protein